MVIYGVALLSISMLIGIVAGDLLGQAIGVEANVGGVGIALLAMTTIRSITDQTYGLGCYLTFYEGLWGLGRLFGGFSFASLLWSLVCCALGFVVVNGLYRLTELCRAVDKGRILGTYS